MKFGRQSNLSRSHEGRRSLAAPSVALLLSLAAAAIVCVPAQAADQNQRNIVFILVDDQRYDALGMLNPFFETPHLDALAENGVFFENAFVTTSLCSPSRASILSGQWAHRHGVLDNNTRLDENIPTFPKALQRAGYRTGFVGKWHMGGSSDDPRPGFDHWVSFRRQGVYYNPRLNINGEHVRHEGYTTDLLTDYAEEFIEQNADEPFMLYLSHKAVHANFEPPERYRGAYAGRAYPFPETMADSEETYDGKPDWVRKQRNTWHGVDGLYNNSIDLDAFTLRYAETLKAVDDSVGRVVAKLRAEGLLESTLLVVTSDNGFQFGEHGLIDKRTMYEASIKVPLIVHCPELFQGGQRRDQLVLNTDFHPTFLDLASLRIPDTVQGESFWPILTQNADGREAFVYTYFWENMFPQTPTTIGVRTKRYKLITYPGLYSPYELYDLERDPQEQNNLISDLYSRTEAGNVEHRVAGAATAYVDKFSSKEEAERVKDLFQRLHDILLAESERLGIARVPDWNAAPER